MEAITIFKGWNIPDFLGMTAFPFAVGSQTGNNGTRPYAWDDLIISPIHIFPVIIVPVIGVMIALKGIK